QILLVALGIGAAALALWPMRRSDRAIGLVLAGLWLWMGVEYHWRFFRPVNPAATLFGSAFVVEAVLLGWAAVRPSGLAFRAPRSLRGGLALALLVYAFAVYPAIGWALGHRYPAAPTFGVPCPTTIATLALLLWTVTRPPVTVMLIPWAWALIGSTATFRLGMWEDLGLPVALVMSLWGWFVQAPRTAPSSPARV
ncbi:MAG TPA: DUF6064 family protein, partial [Gemmatimonadales bacterium]